MQVKEKKICSFTQNGTRLQLIEIILWDINDPSSYIKGQPHSKYQIRMNRKIVETTLSEYYARKIFAQMVTNIVLQLKIY